MLKKLSHLLVLKNPILSFYIIVSIVVRVIFFFYVDRTWEDALITTLHAENFWQGIGLTHYHSGQLPVHGFTSPISVLIPLLGEYFGKGYGLIFIKLCSVVGGALSVWVTYIILRAGGFNPSSPLIHVPLGYVAFEYHQILWGMAGFETQIVVLIALYSIYRTIKFKSSPELFGVSLALMLYARPDMVLWCIAAGALTLYVSVKSTVKSALIAILCYAPWVLFTELYYGSLIPNTIHAKKTAFGGIPLPVSFYDIFRFEKLDMIFSALGPSFGGYGTGYVKWLDNGWISRLSIIFVFIGTYRILTNKWSRLLKAIALFIIVYVIYYLYLVPIVFGWYLAPLDAVSIIAAAKGLEWIISSFNKRHEFVVGVVASFVYLAFLFAPLPLFFKTEKEIQSYIENDVRKMMGEYLGKVMRPDQKVSLEPLGYVSYYSRMDVYDTPGLANKSVVEYYKTLPPDERSLFNIVQYFKPDYVVLRPGFHNMEYDYFLSARWFGALYGSDVEFVADSKKLDKMWSSNATYDREFVIFKRHEIVSRVEADDISGPVTISSSVGPDSLRDKFYVPEYYLRYTDVVNSDKPIVVSTGVHDGDHRLIFYAKGGMEGEKICVTLSLSDEDSCFYFTVNDSKWSLISLPLPKQSNLRVNCYIQLQKSIGKESRLMIAQPFVIDALEGVNRFNNLSGLIASIRLSDFVMDEGWRLGATYDPTTTPPIDNSKYIIGSWIGGDSSTGIIHSNPILAPKNSKRLVLYTYWGPNASRQRIGIDTDGDNVIDQECNLKKFGIWQKCVLRLKEDNINKLSIIAIDGGGSWGEWMAFSQPHIYN